MTDYHLFAEDVQTKAIYEPVEELRSPTDRGGFGFATRRKSARITLVRIAGEVTVS